MAKYIAYTNEEKT